MDHEPAIAHPDELLDLAYHLATHERKRPKQASLRRSVSTAYYALFHLLRSDAVANWKVVDQRPALARAFEHSRMKTASEKASNEQFSNQSQGAVKHLKIVANTFVQLQKDRHDADYNDAREWSRTDVLLLWRQASEAFSSWRAIRDEKIAQDYLLSLLVKPK